MQNDVGYEKGSGKGGRIKKREGNCGKIDKEGTNGVRRYCGLCSDIVNG